MLRSRVRTVLLSRCLYSRRRLLDRGVPRCLIHSRGRCDSEDRAPEREREAPRREDPAAHVDDPGGERMDGRGGRSGHGRAARKRLAHDDSGHEPADPMYVHWGWRGDAALPSDPLANGRARQPPPRLSFGSSPITSSRPQRARAASTSIVVAATMSGNQREAGAHAPARCLGRQWMMATEGQQ